MGDLCDLLGDREERVLIMFRDRRIAGFSLVEMMVTVAVLGILMALGAPAFAEWLANTRLRSSASNILGGLQLARAEAIRTNARVQFQLVGSAGGWQVVREALDAGDQPQRCVFAGGAIVQSSPAPAGSAIAVSAFTDIASTTATAETVFIFGANGWQGCPATAQFQSLNIDSTALSPAESRDLNIIVQLGGGAKLCDVHVPGTDTRACRTDQTGT